LIPEAPIEVDLLAVEFDAGDSGPAVLFVCVINFRERDNTAPIPRIGISICLVLGRPGLDAGAVPDRRLVHGVGAAVGAPAAAPVGTDLRVAHPRADAED
jgi:hypothetical protein